MGRSRKGNRYEVINSSLVRDYNIRLENNIALSRKCAFLKDELKRAKYVEDDYNRLKFLCKHSYLQFQTTTTEMEEQLKLLKNQVSTILENISMLSSHIKKKQEENGDMFFSSSMTEIIDTGTFAQVNKKKRVVQPLTIYETDERSTPERLPVSNVFPPISERDVLLVEDTAAATSGPLSTLLENTIIGQSGLLEDLNMPSSMEVHLNSSSGCQNERALLDDTVKTDENDNLATQHTENITSSMNMTTASMHTTKCSERNTSRQLQHSKDSEGRKQSLECTKTCMSDCIQYLGKKTSKLKPIAEDSQKCPTSDDTPPSQKESFPPYRITGVVNGETGLLKSNNIAESKGQQSLSHNTHSTMLLSMEVGLNSSSGCQNQQAQLDVNNDLVTQLRENITSNITTTSTYSTKCIGRNTSHQLQRAKESAGKKQSFECTKTRSSDSIRVRHHSKKTSQPTQVAEDSQKCPTSDDTPSQKESFSPYRVTGVMNGESGLLERNSIEKSPGQQSLSHNTNSNMPLSMEVGLNSSSGCQNGQVQLDVNDDLATQPTENITSNTATTTTSTHSIKCSGRNTSHQLQCAKGSAGKKQSLKCTKTRTSDRIQYFGEKASELGPIAEDSQKFPTSDDTPPSQKESFLPYRITGVVNRETGLLESNNIEKYPGQQQVLKVINGEWTTVSPYEQKGKYSLRDRQKEAQPVEDISYLLDNSIANETGGNTSDVTFILNISEEYSSSDESPVIEKRKKRTRTGKK